MAVLGFMFLLIIAFFVIIPCAWACSGKKTDTITSVVNRPVVIATNNPPVVPESPSSRSNVFIIDNGLPPAYDDLPPSYEEATS